MVLMNRAKNQTEITDYNHVHRGTSHITASVFIIIFPRSSIVMQSCTVTSKVHKHEIGTHAIMYLSRAHREISQKVQVYNRVDTS